MKRSGPIPRRTPLTAGKPLKRTAGQRVPRPRYTGPAHDVKASVAARDGHVCVICGRPGTTTNPIVTHHRRGRGSGGSKDPATNRASNLLALCARDNHWLEDSTDPAHYVNGWKVHRNGQHAPAGVPVLYPDGRLYLLTDDARKVPA